MKWKKVGRIFGPERYDIGSSMFFIPHRLVKAFILEIGGLEI